MKGTTKADREGGRERQRKKKKEEERAERKKDFLKISQEVRGRVHREEKVMERIFIDHKSKLANSKKRLYIPSGLKKWVGQFSGGFECVKV